MTLKRKNEIDVLIVEDSSFMRLTLQKILSQDPAIKVVGTARDGREGILRFQALRPDVVIMDLEMPIMNGFRALEEIMRWKPTPVIVLSATTTEGAEDTLKALDLGAFEVMAKPVGGPNSDLRAFSRELLEKVKGVSEVDLSHLKQNSVPPATPAPAVSSRLDPLQSAVNTAAAAVRAVQNRPLAARSGAGLMPKHRVEILAIGTSTGGPAALQAVLPVLPANFPVPVLVAQHMPPGFTGPLAQRLNGLCPLNVREGVNGEMLQAGTVYIAPAGKQMQVQRKGDRLVLQIGDESPITTLYRPSVDVMFLSLAKAVGKGALGVVMTGMGSDGRQGMRELKALECFSIVESEETCVVYGMPKSLVDAGLADRITPLGEIGQTIVECVMRRG